MSAVYDATNLLRKAKVQTVAGVLWDVRKTINTGRTQKDALTFQQNRYSVPAESTRALRRHARSSCAIRVCVCEATTNTHTLEITRLFAVTFGGGGSILVCARNPRFFLYCF